MSEPMTRERAAAFLDSIAKRARFWHQDGQDACRMGADALARVAELERHLELVGTHAKAESRAMRDAERDALAAVTRFERNLEFTAPELWGMRVQQLREQIQAAFEADGGEDGYGFDPAVDTEAGEADG